MVYGLRFVFELELPLIFDVRFVFPDEFPLPELFMELVVFMLLGE